MDTSRQSKIVSDHVINDQHPFIIGVGAVGRVVAETLVCNGVPRITICDFDTVEEHNKTTQGYMHDDIGKAKVECVAEHLLKINPEVEVISINDRFRPKYYEASVKQHRITGLFSCVDSLEMREKIFNFLQNQEDKPPIFDARIGGEQIRVLSVFDDDSTKYYPSTITSDDTAYMDGCHVPMIKHAANIGASLLVQQYMACISDKPMYIDRYLPLVGSLILDLHDKSVKEKSNETSTS